MSKILTYRYGLLAPTLGAERVSESMRVAARYANTLTEIEQGRRAALRAVEDRVGLASLMAAHAAADAAVMAAVDAVRAHKSQHRTSKVPADLRDAVTAAKALRAEATTAIREARRRLREEHALEYDTINERAGALRRNAREYSGLGRSGPLFGAWGTYQLVENADQTARAAPLYDETWQPSGPGFCRFDGQGSVGIQIPGGTESTTDTSPIQIRSRARPPSQSPRRNPANVGKAKPDSRRAKHGMWLRMRIGSTDSTGREAVWAEWPMILHRPIPPGARIMAAAVHMRRVGTIEQWSVTLSLRGDFARAPARRAGLVAINLGWRSVPEGVRVATWVGEDEKRGQIVVGHRVLGQLRHAASIRSVRDELFDLARPWTLALLEQLGPAVPEWIRRRTATLAQWKSTAKLSDLVCAWSRARFAGDEDVFAALDAWRRRDRHLWQYETGARRHALARRADEFRRAAAFLASRYDCVVHDGVDLARMKTCPMIEVSDDAAAARANMHGAAPGWLRLAITSAFRGGVVEGDAVEITHTCHACGRVEAFDAAIKIWHRCGACGALWDQDENAARNLLARAIEHGSAAPDPAPACEEEGTTSRAESPRALAKRKALERRARLARGAEGKAAE